MKERVLVFCAHSDDQVLGAGGYLAKLAKEGCEVKTIICSFGEQSHPHLKEMEISKIRVEESEKADKVLGGKDVFFLGLKEGSFQKEFENRGFLDPVVLQLQAFKPTKILTHSSDDPHPDHRATHKMLLEIHEIACPTAEIYSFDIWNLFNLKRRKPKMIVDITHTFKRKIDALKSFKSQRTALALLLWSVYAKAVFWGMKKNCRYAEVFYKIR